MSEKKRLLKNTGLIAIGNMSAKIVSFLLLPLYTSVLSTSEYGTYDYIIVLCTFLSPIITVSMTEAMFRFIIDVENDEEGFQKVVTNAFLIIAASIILSGLVILCLKWAWLHNISDYIWYYLSASSLYSFSNNLLRGQGKIREYAIVSSGKNILTVVLSALSVAVFRLGIHGLLLSMCISEILAFIIVAILSRLHSHIKIQNISLSQIKEMMRYSIPLIPNTLCGTIINLSDRLIVSSILGKASNGIYAISYKFPNVIETVYHYFYTAWSESASRAFSKSKENAITYYQSLYDQISTLVFSIILLMIAGMPILFRVFVRGNYVQGFSYVPILMFAMYFDCMAKYYAGIYTALKKTKAIAISTMIAALINLVINLSLIRLIGLYAAAISTLIADLVLVIIRKLLINDEIRIAIDKKRIAIEILATAMICVMYHYNNWLMTGISLLFAVGYTVIMNKRFFLSALSAITRRRKTKKTASQ